MPRARTNHTPQDRAAEAARKAQELILFCDGLEQSGYDTMAHRGRNVARETVWLASQLELEQAARMAMQAERDRLLALWMTKAGGRAA